MNNNLNDLIIVIVGETGSGKSFISRELLTKYPNIKIITKYTTRKSRTDEVNVSDVKGDISYDDICQMNYQYVNRLNHEYYAFKKSEIDNSLAKGKIPCIDLSNEESYLQICRDYPDKVLLLKIVPYLDEESMKETFEKQGRDSKEFNQRKDALINPLTNWAYKYQNMREILNPSFLRNCPLDLSINVLTKRIETIICDECKKDLGSSLMLDNNSSNGLYEYLYFLSKNKPVDKELTLVSKSLK